MNRWQFPDPDPAVKSSDTLKVSEKDESAVEEEVLKSVAAPACVIKTVSQCAEENSGVSSESGHIDTSLTGGAASANVEYILSWQAMRERLQVTEQLLGRAKNRKVVSYFVIWSTVWIASGLCASLLWGAAFQHGPSSVPGAPIGTHFGTSVRVELLYLEALCVTLWLYSYSMLLRGSSMNASLPSAISLGPNGFFFSFFSQDSSVSSVIPWSAVKGVTVRNVQVNKQNHFNGCLGTMLVFSIDLHDVENRRQFLRQTAAVSDYFSFGIGGILERPMEKVLLHLPLAALSREADGYKFLLDLKARLPECIQNREFRELLDKFSSESFTRLWLDEALCHRRDNLMELVNGQSLQDGRYKIGERIAIGGQATIYRALRYEHSASLSGACEVALKEFVLPAGGAGSAMKRSLESIRKEASLLASLEHPAIPKLLDNFVEDQRAYLCFEFVEGCSLRALVQEKGCLAPGLVLDIADKLADILVYLHGREPSVVHRDLSPDNLMLSSDGRLSLIDFNVAEQLDSGDTKTVVGKQHYIAPEQFKGRPCPQSDLYSMGCCLYYLLTGREPRPLSPSILNLEEYLSMKPLPSRVSGSIDFSSAVSKPEAEPLLAREYLEDLTRLRELILKLTQLSLNDRYQTSAQVRSDLVRKTL